MYSTCTILVELSGGHLCLQGRCALESFGRAVRPDVRACLLRPEKRQEFEPAVYANVLLHARAETAPASHWEDRLVDPCLLVHAGLDYVFAQYLGIWIGGTIYFAAYCLYKRNLPAIYPRVAFPAMISGTMGIIVGCSTLVWQLVVFSCVNVTGGSHSRYKYAPFRSDVGHCSSWIFRRERRALAGCLVSHCDVNARRGSRAS